MRINQTTERVRLKRNHYLNGELKKSGSVIVLKHDTACLLIARGIAVEALKPAPHLARKRK